jgi:hypothetical protein
MKQSLRFSSRLFGACVATLLAGHAAVAQSGQAFYSTFAAPAVQTDYSVGASTTGLCLGCFVSSPERAADSSLDNYAVIQNSLGALGGGVSLGLSLNGTALPSYRAGVVLSTGSLLNVSALATLTLRTYLNGELQQTLSGSDALVSTTLLADSRYGVEFVASKAFNKVEVSVGGILNGINTVRVLYAYGVPGALQLPQAVGYISRSAQPAAGDYVVSLNGGSPLAVCAGTGVANPVNAVDADLNNYATLTTVAGVNSCSANLQVKLDGTAPAGYQAGFVVGNASVLDLNVLQNLQITTYLNGAVQETRRGADLLQLVLLPDNRYQVSFKSRASFDRVALQQSALVSALNTLQVYYGFGIEPRAFRDDTPVLSNFTSPQRGSEYQESASGLLCLGCGSTGAAKAADNVFTPGDYAEVRFPVLALGTYKLKLRLNGTGSAGSRAGVVLRTNNGLLNTSVLQNIRLTTYSGPNGDQVVETASGAGLLDLGLVNDNRHEVAFLTKQEFQWVELELAGGVGLFSDARIYYAFAEQTNPSFPTVVGSPVVLPPSEARTVLSSAAESALVLNVFPNPASGSQAVRIELARTPAAGSTIQLYNTLGQMVRLVPASEQLVELPTVALGAGLYHLVLVDAKGSRLANRQLVVAAQ